VGASENFVIGQAAACGTESTASRSLWHGKHRKSVRGLVSARYGAHSAAIRHTGRRFCHCGAVESKRKIIEPQTTVTIFYQSAKTLFRR